MRTRSPASTSPSSCGWARARSAACAASAASPSRTSGPRGAARFLGIGVGHDRTVLGHGLVRHAIVPLRPVGVGIGARGDSAIVVVSRHGLTLGRVARRIQPDIGELSNWGGDSGAAGRANPEHRELSRGRPKDRNLHSSAAFSSGGHMHSPNIEDSETSPRTSFLIADAITKNSQ